MEKELSDQEKDLLYFKWRYGWHIKIIKSLEDLGVLIDGVTETVKDEIKKPEGRFLGVLLAPSDASLVQPVISSVVKGISGRGVRRTLRGYIDRKF